MAEQDSQEPSGADRRLDYRDGGADPVPVKAGQVIGGIAASIVLIMGAGFLGFYLTSLQKRESGWPFFISVGLAALFCMGWASVSYRKPTTHGLGIGLWIGFGVAVLIEGACFGIMRS